MKDLLRKPGDLNLISTTHIVVGTEEVDIERSLGLNGWPAYRISKPQVSVGDPFSENKGDSS